jgi:uncharacterized protein (DUF169 family)
LNLGEAAKQLASSLKLDSAPVAVKFFKKSDEASAERMLLGNGFERPKEPLNTCQLVALARLRGRKMFASQEDMACVVGGVVLGLSEEPFHMKKGYLASTSRRDLESALEFTSTIPRVNRQVGLVAFCPLDLAPVEPDVVVVYGNSLQVMLVIQSYLWDRPGRVEVALGGEFSVCGDVVAKTYVTKRLQFSIPCNGERTSAGVSDSEMSVGIPGKDVEGVCEAMKKPQFQVTKSMVKHELDRTPSYFPDTFLTPQARRIKNATKSRKVRPSTVEPL